MRLIINADDFGMAQSVNDAILELCQKRRISSTSVMSNMPLAHESVRLLAFKDISIGLHVNLTQGKPLSSASSVSTLVDERGYFLPKKTLLKNISQKKVAFEHIKTEVWAQFFKLKELVGSRISHFDSHQGSTRIGFVYKALNELKKQKYLDAAIRVHSKYYFYQKDGRQRIISPGYNNISMFGLKRVLAEYYFRHKRNTWRHDFKTPDGMLFNRDNNTLSILIELLSISGSIENNGVYEISCHPSIHTDDLAETEMLEVRVKEYLLLKSEAFRDALRHIDLISFNAL